MPNMFGGDQYDPDYDPVGHEKRRRAQKYANSRKGKLAQLRKLEKDAKLSLEVHLMAVSDIRKNISNIKKAIAELKR